jgi:hypothetical protein
MIYGGVPFLREELIVFPEGQFDLNDCTLASLENLFKLPYPNSKNNYRTFGHSDGELIAFFHPAEQITKASKVLAMDYLPKTRLKLSRFVSFYKKYTRPPRCVLSLPDENNVVRSVMAVFSLNLQLICTLDEESIVETISFLSTNHVLTCGCSTCGIIRNTILQPAVSRHPKAPMTVN